MLFMSDNSKINKQQLSQSNGEWESAQCMCAVYLNSLPVEGKVMGRAQHFKYKH